MRSLSARSFDTVFFSTLAVLGVAIVCSFALIPRLASAETVLVTSVTATSSNVYTNTGFATTSRVTTDDAVKYQLTLDATPWVAPQINIFSMGSTTMSGSGASWFYSTTSATTWTEGPITFFMSVGSTTAATVGTTTVSQSSITTNVTYDKTAPTLLDSISWSDVDGSLQFSATDTLTLTFSETMATSTITAGNVDTTLALSGSHTFGTSPTVSWNTAGTILTLTLGTSPTLATADTVDPTTAVKDSVGIADATSAARTITDNISPSTPTGLTDTTRQDSIRIILVSTGSSEIRYTIDSTTPSCTVGTVYSGEFTIAVTTTLKALGCDEADNASSVVTAVYTIEGTGGSSGSVGGGGGQAKPTIQPSPVEGCAVGNLFSTTTGKSCSTSTTPASGCAAGNLFSTTTGKACGTTTTTTTTTTNVTVQFTTDLELGSQGPGVKALQVFFNTHGYAVASTGPGSPGNETSFFGNLTKAAVIKYQKAKSITPAVGYFGPKTRAAVNAEK